jgi:hypothetical protein
MDARPVAISLLLHVCAAAAIGHTIASSRASSSSSGEDPTARHAYEARAHEIEVEFDAPKARRDGTLAGSDRAGTARALGSRLATAGTAGEDAPEDTTVDARFGIVALVESSRGVAVGDNAWAPNPGGGAQGLYAGSAFGDGLGVSGTGIGASRDGAGVGLGTLGARGLSGITEGTSQQGGEDLWNGWQGGYARPHHDPQRRWARRIIHPDHIAPVGPLEGMTIRGVVMADSALDGCYRDALSRHSDLEGVVRVDFLIDREGAVAAVKDGGSALYDVTLIQCMMQRFWKLDFPRAPAMTRVSYPMKLGLTSQLS